MDVLNSLLNNLDEALIILDNQGKILLFNEAASKLSQAIFHKTFKPGLYFSDLTDPETSSIIRETIEGIQQKKIPERHFEEFVNQNGTSVSVEFHYVPIINEEGVATHINLFIRDLTDQKIFEKKLTTQASNVKSLIEKSSAIIIGLDTGGYVIDWNEHCEKITGFSKDDVYAQKFIDVLLKNVDHGKFDEILAGMLKNELTVSKELMIRSQKGKLITLLLSCTPRLSDANQIVGWTLVGQDVTELAEYRMSLEMKVEERTRELKRALQKEKEVVEMKSRFVSIASHEFRSPLSSIQFQANYIKQNKEQISSNDLERRLDSIEKQTQHMSVLLDDILAYSKNEAHKIELDLTSIVLVDFLNKTMEEVGHYIRKGTHAIKTEYALIPEVITSDVKLLRSILINLLTNAVKFSPGKEWVYFTARGSGGRLIITVRDEGIGIPEDEINKVFEPFLRGRTVASIEGTGLGLSIVKRSIELLSGAIHTSSEVGKGTTFTVTIPIEQNIS